jgi:TonB family protein
MRTPFFFALVLAAHTSMAQDTGASAPPAPFKPAPVRKLSLRPISPAYPPELVKAGVQGTATVLATLGSDGFPERVTIQASSRSSDLDAAAITLVKNLNFKVSSAASEPTLAAVLVPVEFLKDSVATLPQKTCEDFNLDLKYFKSAFPEKRPEELDVVRMAVGTLAVSMAASMPREKQLAFFKSIHPAVASTFAICGANPDKTMFEVLRQAVRESMAAL